MFARLLIRSIAASVPVIQLHNQDTYKHLYNYYSVDDKLQRSDILKYFVGYKVENEKSLDGLIPESLTLDQFVVLCELLNTPKRRLLLAFKTLDLDSNQVLTRQEMNAISVVEKDMSYKDFQTWIEKLQDTVCLIKFRAHAVNNKIEPLKVAQLLMLAKPLPNSIKKHHGNINCDSLTFKEFSDLWKLLNENEKLHDVLAFLGPKNIDFPLFERAIVAASASSNFTVSTNTCSLLFQLLDTDKSGFLDNKEIINFFESKFDSRNELKLVHCFKKAKESLEF
eukprot:NODE_193_length_15440_cov_0.478587.p7 type:complete len:281 gc:universal NODE_193_length_15440_cov_0.478587:8882-8040(-)